MTVHVYTHGTCLCISAASVASAISVDLTNVRVTLDDDSAPIVHVKLIGLAERGMPLALEVQSLSNLTPECAVNEVSDTEYTPAPTYAPTRAPTLEVDCRMEDWNTWSLCSKSCGEGIHAYVPCVRPCVCVCKRALLHGCFLSVVVLHRRFRAILQMPRGGGEPCDDDYETDTCQIEPCIAPTPVPSASPSETPTQAPVAGQPSTAMFWLDTDATQITAVSLGLVRDDLCAHTHADMHADTHARTYTCTYTRMLPQRSV